ncbi:MAG TPA: STAS domain-containing protein [Casimicrobiaceae bacterium]|nr:STAS domain-containing protein [Casimicrobiaceae bacterium]
MSEGTPASGFSLADGGARWVFAGQLVFDNAETVLEAARELPLPAGGQVDLSGLGHADSSALAVLLALRRRAAAERKALAYASMPPLLASLARVYGVDELIGV